MTTMSRAYDLALCLDPVRDFVCDASSKRPTREEKRVDDEEESSRVVLPSKGQCSATSYGAVRCDVSRFR